MNYQDLQPIDSSEVEKQLPSQRGTEHSPPEAQSKCDPKDSKEPPINPDQASRGLTLKDLLPVPEDSRPLSDNKVQHHAMEQKPTASHALAVESNKLKGNVQGDGGPGFDKDDVANLGWNEPQRNIPAPLVGGIGNEELWVLIRRFNKVCFARKDSDWFSC